VIADIDAPEPAEEKINAYLAAEAANVDGIITTAWVPAVVASNALRRLGDKRIHMVGIDHDEVVIQAIKDGFVDGTMLRTPTGRATSAPSRRPPRSGLHGGGRRAIRLDGTDRQVHRLRAPPSSMRPRWTTTSPRCRP
jgi:hypothetical protein